MKKVLIFILVFLSLSIFIGWRSIVALENYPRERRTDIILVPAFDLSVHRTFTGETLSGAKYIALTFDDGPHKKYTPLLLDILDTYDVPATFYVIGQNISGKEDILERMQRAGHEVASHSWSHTRYTSMDTATIIADRDQTERAIYQSTGVWPDTYRPPYGLTSSGIQNSIERRAILWNVDPGDWRYRNSATTTRNITTTTKSNSIILMHDIYETSIDAVPSIIENLQAQGYTFVTVSELLYRNGEMLGGTGVCMSGVECH